MTELNWDIARQVPLSIVFPRQEYWSGRPFPPPGDLPDPGIKLVSPALAGIFFTTEPQGSPINVLHQQKTVCYTFLSSEALYSNQQALSKFWNNWQALAQLLFNTLNHPNSAHLTLHSFPIFIHINLHA